MDKRINIASGTEWETVVGYSRAVKVGNLVEVSGTVAVDEYSKVIGENDAYLQTAFIIKKIEAALLQAGATLNDVVRTRMFVTDIKLWQQIAKAHAEAFININPCTTMVEVKSLMAPEYLIEIEATAVLTP